MRTITSIKDLKNAIKASKLSGKTVGFVPTMGYLHDGHASLLKYSIEDNEYTVLSIFVNPIQFSVNEDFSKYPRDIARDVHIAEGLGVDIIFVPTVEEMYPEGFKTCVEIEQITNKLCGATRPGHFKGVATVVNKLFNIIGPDRAYFGQKDAQQAAVIKQMVKDMNMNVEIIVCPIVREADGLAMSSRNVYLSPGEKKAATILSETLFAAGKLIQDGERDKGKVLGFITSQISSEPLARIEYTDIVNADTLEDIKVIQGRVLVALAVKIGNTRLIDNIVTDAGLI